MHVAAALDRIGGLLGTESFPTTPAGYRQLLAWLGSFGTIGQVGVEGTSSYGAGLTRALQAAGVTVVEVDRPNRQVRRRVGKSDALDAVAAARSVLAGTALGAPKAMAIVVSFVWGVVAAPAGRWTRQRRACFSKLLISHPDRLVRFSTSPRR